MIEHVNRVRFLYNTLETIKELSIFGSFICYTVLFQYASTTEVLILLIVGFFSVLFSYAFARQVFTINAKITKFTEFYNDRKTIPLKEIYKALRNAHYIPIYRDILITISLMCYIPLLYFLRQIEAIQIAAVGTAFTSAALVIFIFNNFYMSNEFLKMGDFVYDYEMSGIRLKSFYIYVN